MSETVSATDRIADHVPEPIVLDPLTDEDTRIIRNAIKQHDLHSELVAVNLDLIEALCCTLPSAVQDRIGASLDRIKELV